MREWCGCGASIRARRKDVLVWRDKHRHDSKEEPEPEKQGSFADTQIAHSDPIDAYSETYTPTVNARIGFTPNGYSIRSVALAEQLRAKALKNLGRDA